MAHAADEANKTRKMMVNYTHQLVCFSVVDKNGCGMSFSKTMIEVFNTIDTCCGVV